MNLHPCPYDPDVTLEDPTCLPPTSTWPTTTSTVPVPSSASSSTSTTPTSSSSTSTPSSTTSTSPPSTSESTSTPPQDLCLIGGEPVAGVVCETPPTTTGEVCWTGEGHTPGNGWIDGPCPPTTYAPPATTASTSGAMQVEPVTAASVAVPSGSAPTELAFTGSGIPMMLAFAFILLVVGAALLLGSRDRTDQE
jgi:hypothetical protein